MLELKEGILFYIKHLYTIDLVFILLVLFVFVCFLLFVVMLHEKPIWASFVLFLSLVICPVFAYFGYKFIDDKVRHRILTVIDNNFYDSSNLAIDLSIENKSKYDFSYCKIIAKLYKTDDSNLSTLDKYKQKYIPFRLKSKILENNLTKNEVQEHRINFENVSTDENLTIRLDSRCF